MLAGDVHGLRVERHRVRLPRLDQPHALHSVAPRHALQLQLRPHPERRRQPQARLLRRRPQHAPPDLLRPARPRRRRLLLRHLVLRQPHAPLVPVRVQRVLGRCRSWDRAAWLEVRRCCEVGLSCLARESAGRDKRGWCCSRWRRLSSHVDYGSGLVGLSLRGIRCCCGRTGGELVNVGEDPPGGLFGRAQSSGFGSHFRLLVSLLGLTFFTIDPYDRNGFVDLELDWISLFF